MDDGPSNNEPSSSAKDAAGNKNEPVKEVDVEALRSVPVRPAGRECQLFNDQVFCELRAYAQVPNDFVNTGWSLDALEKGGGKGGTLMAPIGDAYIVKELSRSDHQVLLLIAESYYSHVRSGETLLCPIYLHFCDTESGRTFFAMRNSVGRGPFLALYDLKGCADDKTIERDGQRIQAVHKRIWNVRMWCSRSSWTEERRRYYRGKQAARCVDIALLEEQRGKVLHCIRRDTQWLVSHRLMDYSLLVAIKEGAAQGSLASGGSGPSSLGHRPLVQRDPEGGVDVALHVSIIDFLQRWTCGKTIARCIKVLETNKATVPPAVYADRFLRHFEARLRSTSSPQGVTAAPPASVVGSIAPPAGDTDAEGKPEDRLHSRQMPESEAPSCASRAVGGEDEPPGRMKSEL